MLLEVGNIGQMTLKKGQQATTKDLYQVQETWKFFFLTYIQLCVLTLFLKCPKSCQSVRWQHITQRYTFQFSFHDFT